MDMPRIGGILGVALLFDFTALAEVIKFDRYLPGQTPAGWTVAMTHVGAPPQWEVLRDESGPRPQSVLAQTSGDKTAGRFPLAIWQGATIRDGEVSVAFKTVEGVVDQAGGIVWRYQDPSNYYIVRANALENNVVLYKVENGIRLSIAPKGLPSRSYGVKRDVPSGRWNRLKVAFTGNVFTVFFNGERLFDAEDGALVSAGKTGLWTKADSVTYFDEFTVTGSDETKPSDRRSSK
jgi:hypothetical protein